MSGDKQKSQINILLQEKSNLTKIISDVREEITLLNSKLDGITKSVCMLNCICEILNEILCVGKVSIGMKGISFDYGSMDEENKFVPPKQKTEFLISDYMSKQHARCYYQHISPFKKTFWRCHCCD